MLAILKRDDEEISRQAAQLIASAVRKKPSLALGLATGGTMVGVYKYLVDLHKQGSLDFSRVVTFNLDEYLGLTAAHPRSFHHFMRENLFAHVNVNPSNIHIPDGTIRAITISTALPTKRQSKAPEESTFSSWASDATATWASTSRLPASAPARV